MKKYLWFLLAGVLLLCLTTCKKPAVSDQTTGSTESAGQQATETKESNHQQATGSTGENIDYKTKYPVRYQSGEHYAIYMNTDTPVEFYYIVKDQGGSLIDQGIKDYRGSFGFSYSNGLLVMDYGGVSQRYYDVESGRVSEFFPDPVANSDTLVAYFTVDSGSKITLTVQDIFDESAYCVQIPRAYSDWVFKNAGSYKGEFLEDNTKLKFTYPIGDKGETVTETVNLPGRSLADQQLLQVLRNEKPFIAEDSKTLYLQDYKVYGSQDAVVERYAWVDFDGDGANELVTYLAPDLAYMVFHLEQDKVYGFVFEVSWLMELKADGTHYASSGASISDYYTLSFKNGKYEKYELAFHNGLPGMENSPADEEYRIGGKSVTPEEFSVFLAEFRNKPCVAWYPNTAPGEISDLYMDFLAGKSTALDNGTERTLESYLRSFYSQIGPWQYTFLDMNGDGVAELCVKHFELYIFTIKAGRVCAWYTDTNMYTMPLNNGAFLIERHGAAPTHINYEYYTLDENGKETFRISFSWYDGATIEEGKIYPDRYYVNEQEVTKEEYEEKVSKYLEISQAKVTWYHRDGEGTQT